MHVQVRGVIITVVVIVLLVIVVLIVTQNQLGKPCKSVCELQQSWHVPDDQLEQFSLNAFVLAPDYLYIENANGEVVFSDAVRCLDIYKGNNRFINVQSGPAFLRKVRAERVYDRLHLFTADDELIAVLDQL